MNIWDWSSVCQYRVSTAWFHSFSCLGVFLYQHWLSTALSPEAIFLNAHPLQSQVILLFLYKTNKAAIIFTSLIVRLSMNIFALLAGWSLTIIRVCYLLCKRGQDPKTWCLTHRCTKLIGRYVVISVFNGQAFSWLNINNSFKIFSFVVNWFQMCVFVFVCTALTYNLKTFFNAGNFLWYHLTCMYSSVCLFIVCIRKP